jgi:hypothetical protein
MGAMARSPELSEVMESKVERCTSGSLAWVDVVRHDRRLERIEDLFRVLGRVFREMLAAQQLAVVVADAAHSDDAGDDVIGAQILIEALECATGGGAHDLDGNPRILCRECRHSLLGNLGAVEGHIPRHRGLLARGFLELREIGLRGCIATGQRE